MTDIIFKKNKPKYLFIILLLSTLITFLLYIGILWISNPNKYIFWLLPNKHSVILFCFLSFFGAFILLYILIKSIFNKNFYVKINKDGLFLGIIQYSNKLIHWKDITGIESVEINGIKHILIYIKNIEYYKKYEKGIQKYFFVSRNEKYKTPFVINVSALSDNFNDIIKSIITSWEKFK
ncbi:STM3941 family protein [Chryseobacterium taihuense]|uniref:PH domain-containing protein n=1 Tax=Chryseobacterium taihuense TaxID=1141221 RepID=A0ABY0R0F8_9FLAO|nr:STM3941 family protein [Chryseobacterium taihuense]SDM20496.1 hypothetical protein SAMN05216273_1177 [Chryseobacterium taihuense]